MSTFQDMYQSYLEGYLSKFLVKKGENISSVRSSHKTTMETLAYAEGRFDSEGELVQPEEGGAIMMAGPDTPLEFLIHILEDDIPCSLGGDTLLRETLKTAIEEKKGKTFLDGIREALLEELNLTLPSPLKDLPAAFLARLKPVIEEIEKEANPLMELKPSLPPVKDPF